jgi:anaphase-promoting complex subunit 1
MRPKLCFSLDKTLKHMVELCTTSVALALGCVMAGTGDLDCLRIFRELRWKVDDQVYGTHMAYGMAIGELFFYVRFFS